MQQRSEKVLTFLLKYTRGHMLQKFGEGRNNNSTPLIFYFSLFYPIFSSIYAQKLEKHAGLDLLARAHDQVTVDFIQDQ